MGEFRFLIPKTWELDSYQVHSIHVVGLDGIPWPCRIASGTAENEARKIISISRNNDNSGKVYIHFPIPKFGEFLICTGTLPVREEPYELIVELARGTLNRLRNQLSIWQEGGLTISTSVFDLVKSSSHLLGKAILSPIDNEKDELATESIALASEAIFSLSGEFGTQISEFRRNHSELSDFWMAASAKSLRDAERIEQLGVFELIQLGISPDSDHSQFQSKTSNIATKAPSRIILGPWLDASVGGMPEHLMVLDDFPVRRNHIVNELRQDLRNLPESTSLLHIVGGVNGIGHRHLSHSQQIQLTADLLRQVEESEADIPTMISFDFPWAERLAGAVGGVHPLQIADSLLRQGLEISVLGLEINLDYWPNGSTIRDPLQWIDLVDIWAQLGLPLVLILRVPECDDDQLKGSTDRMVNSSPGKATSEQRIEFLKTVIPMMIARPAVYGLVWAQADDHTDSRYPGAGIFQDHQLKTGLKSLIKSVRSHIDGN
ncbi:MAG: hypothetical protein AAF939_05095 [Planctomycetota bacterium]